MGDEVHGKNSRHCCVRKNYQVVPSPLSSCDEKWIESTWGLIDC